MQILDELAARGLVADVTDRDALAKLLGDGPVTLYAGYDPTAPSLHVGNLVPVIMQARLQRAGHKPIVVVGGATGMIGDPSGKSAERNLLDDDELEANLAGHPRAAGAPPRLRARTHGRRARQQRRLDARRRLPRVPARRRQAPDDQLHDGEGLRASRLEGDTGISYTEFSYMLLQAWDFVHLSRAYGCRLQVGGSDQYGNITAGCELSRKMGGPQLFGLTAPLLLDSSGQKMGKTSTGERVWLDAERTSPYAFYQYFFNVDGRRSPASVAPVLAAPARRARRASLREHDEDPSQRGAQRALARDA